MARGQVAEPCDMAGEGLGPGVQAPCWVSFAEATDFVFSNGVF